MLNFWNKLGRTSLNLFDFNFTTSESRVLDLDEVVIFQMLTGHYINLNNTAKLQKRAILTINKSGFKSHADPLFKRSDILKLKDLYEYQTALSILYFINNGLPLSFNSRFEFNHQIQNIHITRQTNLLYITRASKLPLYTFPHIRNKWSSMIPNNTSRAQTKHQLKTCFLGAYHSSVKCTGLC